MNFKELAECYEKMTSLKDKVRTEEKNIDELYEQMGIHEVELCNTGMDSEKLNTEMESYKKAVFQKIGEKKMAILGWHQEMSMEMAKHYMIKNYLKDMQDGEFLTTRALKELSTQPYANMPVTENALKQLAQLKYCSQNNWQDLNKKIPAIEVMKKSLTKKSILDRLKQKSPSIYKPKMKAKEFSL